MSAVSTDYSLVSAATGTRRSDKGGWTLEFTDEEPSLIRAEYAAEQLMPRDDLEGVYRYADWLPIRNALAGSSAPASYKSATLAKALGLENLWITFNGWWPEKGAAMRTGTFKELEAFSVCGRLPENFGKILVVASAGNTARSFARVCSDNGIPLLLFVPADNLDALWFDTPIAPHVKLLAPEAGGDYFDAIRMSGAVVSGSERFIPEGGAKNVARRDGMATTVLSASTAIGRIPDFYFQAVGSGTGAIAAWEASMRLRKDGRFGENPMRLMLSQNTPFTPMVDSWKTDSRTLIIGDDEEARSQAAKVNAKVLTNRRPPWGVPGGLYDALKASGGRVSAIGNREAAAAGSQFERLEGMDISPAAAVAVADLFQAVGRSEVNRNDTIMLNVTGGGMKRFKRDRKIHRMKPGALLPLNASDADILIMAEKLFP